MPRVEPADPPEQNARQKQERDDGEFRHQRFSRRRAPGAGSCRDSLLLCA
jgi:hypothetical protein